MKYNKAKKLFFLLKGNAMKKSELTACRFKMRRLIKEQAKLFDIFLDNRSLVKGTVYKMKTKCGKAGCRCHTEGELHTAWRITRSHQGKAQARCIEKGTLRTYRKFTRNYRDFRQARARLNKIQREMKELIDRLEAGRTTEPDIFRKKK